MAIPRPLAAPAFRFDRLVICMRASIWRQLLVLYTVAMPAMAAAPSDRTDATLARCLDDPANASTAGQTDCETRAKQAWDRRMNTAYATLMKRLTADAAHRLRLSQRAWLAFRDADAQARASFLPAAGARCTSRCRPRPKRQSPATGRSSWKPGFAFTRSTDDPRDTSRLFLMALIVWGLAILAGHTLYEGLTTGCVKAKYGWHCQATAPILYVFTITLTGVACCCSIGIGTIFATFALRRTR